MLKEYRIIIIAWVITLLLAMVLVGTYLLASSDTQADSKKQSVAIKKNAERSKDNKAKLETIDKKCSP